jgi:hypothetical protein
LVRGDELAYDLEDRVAIVVGEQRAHHVERRAEQLAARRHRCFGANRLSAWLLKLLVSRPLIHGP